MNKDFILPDIGEGIVECEVIEWKVKEGDLIEEDQIVVDVSTDKAIVEIPSMYNGRVTKLYYQESDTAEVHKPLFAIEVEGEEQSRGQPEDNKQAATVAVPVMEVPVISAAATSDKVLTTPAVRKMAREHSLDLATIAGTGKQGRVLKEDVLAYLNQKAGKQTATVQVNSIQDRREPIKGVRKIMAERMADSVATIPHFTFIDELDITELMGLRSDLVKNHSSDDLKITLMPLFIKALSLALNEFPIVNSRANTEFTELTYLASHNIGMAVDGKTGLLVPNIKNVQQLGLLDVAREVNRLTEAARSGVINPADLAGGSITISNIGVIGGTAAMPIINKPEVAIVALGKIQKLPRFDANNNIVSRSILTVSWSGDHRVIDGGTIARFNKLWKQYLEQPQTMLLAMLEL
ncbi:2-oxo acid dehydrogenase subunit E2 [Porticoccaceae bacterium]|jgi:2-oxoisovalerate dehydrogenase E2 component (dihydrolipoyl transacylase)|nr:2-oxo acid dehydrogenase subunit E2 [Porticoccaceae bacterium]MDA8902844.1 2-oxo acid dehydrogenase subunit E2 [Porticoccaceae bacterium]MDA8935816.1 2-oxo acid dehydrogenase subunit E2 [Porticoccaceae bacterium]MDC0953340.1 2-oxo acid dehydrogenase subunit E2 [Porticoccaceae bacterium]MDG1705450.1 2-oxo acid dehydrogenase subunit E2 [Porticoccaceae bacterium]